MVKNVFPSGTPAPQGGPEKSLFFIAEAQKTVMFGPSRKSVISKTYSNNYLNACTFEEREYFFLTVLSHKRQEKKMQRGGGWGTEWKGEGLEKGRLVVTEQSRGCEVQHREYSQ